jgi:membrane protease subunit HflC
MPARTIPIVIAAALVLLIVVTSLFTVSETELAIRTEFGAILDSKYDPGLHWKLPWDQVVKFDRRILTQSYQGETFLTKWRVNSAARYFRTTGAQEDIAGERISEIVKDGIKSVVAQHTLQEIVASERSAVTGEMFGGASRAVSDLGVDLVDVRVQRIDLPPDVASRVYENMKQNFAKIASRLRAEGGSAAMSTRASAERERTEIISNAKRDALRVQGAADAQAADTYARAYSANPEFYSFWRSLQAYEASLGKDGDVFVLAPEGEFFKYLKDPNRAAAPPPKR